MRDKKILKHKHECGLEDVFDHSKQWEVIFKKYDYIVLIFSLFKVQWILRSTLTLPNCYTAFITAFNIKVFYFQLFIKSSLENIQIEKPEMTLSIKSHNIITKGKLRKKENTKPPLQKFPNFVNSKID